MWQRLHSQIKPIIQGIERFSSVHSIFGPFYIINVSENLKWNSVSLLAFLPSDCQTERSFVVCLSRIRLSGCSTWNQMNKCVCAVHSANESYATLFSRFLFQLFQTFFHLYFVNIEIYRPIHMQNNVNIYCFSDASSGRDATFN